MHTGRTAPARLSAPGSSWRTASSHSPESRSHRSDGLMAEKRSDDYPVEVPEGITPDEMQRIVERAADSVGLYISHIGSYSRKKYPNSVHWHFKRDPKEPGLLDATYWDVKSLFWLMIRRSEPKWVQRMVPKLLRALRREVADLVS